MQRLLTIIIAAFAVSNTCVASFALDDSNDFYTPMSTMIAADREYLLTSNAHAPKNISGNLASYETLLFLKFDTEKLPQNQVERVWLRMASGPSGSMGSSSEPILLSVHPVDRDIMDIVNGNITPTEFYVDNNHILNAAEDKCLVHKDGVCYWDITEIVNSWISYRNTEGDQGYENLGLAVTGRNDPDANNPDNSSHIGFWSGRAYHDFESAPHATVPALIFTEGQSGFSKPWIPDWSQNDNFTCQYWTMSAANGHVEQELEPDGFVFNDFGVPNIVWEEELEINNEEIINPFLTWHPMPDSVEENTHPKWVDGVYGGVFRGSAYSDHTLTANVPVGDTANALTVLVQYDWYEKGNINVTLDGATDITPDDFEDFIISTNSQNNQSGKWYRSIKVFELQPASNNLNVNFTISGDEPYIDSFAITTAENATMPTGPLRSEADIDLSGTVNLADFATFSSEWYKNGENLKADIAHDGKVNTLDLFIFCDKWLTKSNYSFQGLWE